MIVQEAENNNQNSLEYRGFIIIILIFEKKEYDIEAERNLTIKSVLEKEKKIPKKFPDNFPKDPKLSLCESGQNILDKNKQVGYYGMDNGWIIYVS